MQLGYGRGYGYGHVYGDGFRVQGLRDKTIACLLEVGYP